MPRLDYPHLIELKVPNLTHLARLQIFLRLSGNFLFQLARVRHHLTGGRNEASPVGLQSPSNPRKTCPPNRRRPLASLDLCCVPHFATPVPMHAVKAGLAEIHNQADH